MFINNSPVDLHLRIIWPSPLRSLVFHFLHVSSIFCLHPHEQLLPELAEKVCVTEPSHLWKAAIPLRYCTSGQVYDSRIAIYSSCTWAPLPRFLLPFLLHWDILFLRVRVLLLTDLVRIPVFFTLWFAVPCAWALSIWKHLFVFCFRTVTSYNASFLLLSFQGFLLTF